ncbi:transglycosylase domain-containing protein [Flexivirga caeni]|nr:transglycosylase domain-containing protein [Flexivirga caeni]
MRVATRLGTVLSLIGALIATAVAMGLIAACLALPALGAAGQATNGSIKIFNDMPGSFAMNPLAQQSKILAADGSVLATPFSQNRIVVPYDKISQNMKNAQVAIEDERFFEHGAIDPRGLTRAIVSNIFSNGTQGASTLTQQYVKIALQNQALNAGNTKGAQEAVSRTGMEGYVRKLQQLKYAVTMEQKYTKPQILDGYLNLVPYGGNIYGVEAAALSYFGVHASQLNLQQSAMMAGIVNEPGVLNPFMNPKGVLARRNVVLGKMYQQKMISRKQLIAAQNSPLGLHPTEASSNSCANSKYPYFCYYVISWLETQPALGKSPRERLATLQSGGLTIKTSFSPKLADVINKQIRAKVPQGNSADVQSAGVIVQPGTGLVLASGQNTTYSNTGGDFNTAVNFNIPGSLGGGSAGFQIGSTQKLFAVITALEHGYTPDSLLTVPPYDAMSPGSTSRTYDAHAFTHQDFPGACGLGQGEDWNLPNDVPEPAAGSKMTLSDATAQSINTIFASLVSKLGACNVLKTTTKLGVRMGNGSTIEAVPSSIVLGTSDVAPVDVANAYATIASGGIYCPPRPVVSITDGNGKQLKLAGTACKRVLTKKVAAETTQVLESVLTNPAGTTNGDVLLDGGRRPAAGKTGTNDNAANIWFAGYTPQMATAVWVGHEKNTAPMKNITLAGTFYKGYVFGGQLAAPIWEGIMNAALEGQPIKYFMLPDGTTPTTAPSTTSSSSSSSYTYVPPSTTAPPSSTSSSVPTHEPTTTHSPPPGRTHTGPPKHHVG